MNWDGKFLYIFDHHKCENRLYALKEIKIDSIKRPFVICYHFESVPSFTVVMESFNGAGYITINRFSQEVIDAFKELPTLEEIEKYTNENGFQYYE